MPAVPRVFETIRFRLSLTIALVVFAVGSMLIGGSYIWQVNRLDQPVLNLSRVVFEDPESGELIETDLRLFTRDDLNRLALEQVEVAAEREALDELRRTSFVALMVLFVSSFGAGYLLSGWALRPVGRITRLARDISATDLSRRLEMSGPEDELKQMADTFDGMLDRLQGSFEDQRRFVHEASHELRNPLAVAQTNLELALGSDDHDELADAARIALRSTNRMSGLVEGLLEQARTGVPELHRESIDLGVLVNEIATEFTALAARRKLRIEAGTVAIEDLVVEGDGPAVRRAVSNLVANAVRLAPEGSVIRLSARRIDDVVAVQVVDEGPGIDPADHEAIFHRFWRGQDVGAGSGLGLSIVRRVAERHGGTATVESAPGSGSTFTLRLPAPIHRRMGDRPADIEPVIER
jgi:signal transduction histidine kinase